MKNNQIKFYALKLKTSICYFILGLVYHSPISKGDRIKCHGIGYPHWKNQEFECTMDFKDGTIGILNGVRVAKKDFGKISIKKR